MRICLVSSNLHPVPCAGHGAVETQMLAQARGLAELGHEVHVVTVGEPDDGTSPEAPGVRFHRLGPAREAGGGGARSGVGSLLASQLRFGLRARRLYPVISPDILHWHARYPCLVGHSAAAPWVGVYHAHNWKRAEDMAYPAFSPRRAAALVGARVDRRIARSCRHVIAVSEFLKERIVQSAGVSAGRVSVLTNVVDDGLFGPELGERAGTRSAEILFVGRIAAEKGLAPLIEAVELVARDVPEVTLTVIGPRAGGTERGAYQRRCEELVGRLGLEARVHFAGPLPNRELPERLRRAALLVVPSVWGEPCGVVVLEGLACGIPVVASRVGGIPELIDEGVNGLLCDPDDARSLASAIRRALTDGELRRSCALHGPEAVARRHTPDRVGRRLAEIYGELLEARDGRAVGGVA